jgi:hypothetical protein
MKMHWLLVHAWRLVLCLVLVVVTLLSSQQPSSVTGFTTPTTLLQLKTRFKMQEKCWFLFMGKGFNSARNKQEDLARKMQLIKQQRENGDTANVKVGHEPSSSPSTKNQDAIKRQQEERDLFSKLLAKNPPPRRDEESSVTRIKTTRSAVVLQQQNAFGPGTIVPKLKAKGLKRKRKPASMTEQNAKKQKSKCLFNSPPKHYAIRDDADESSSYSHTPFFEIFHHHHHKRHDGRRRIGNNASVARGRHCQAT